jgi:hypothetical protein
MKHCHTPEIRIALKKINEKKKQTRAKKKLTR